MNEEEEKEAKEAKAEAEEVAIQEEKDRQEYIEAEAEAEANREKNSETLEQKEARLARQLFQTRKKMGKADESTSKSDELDYGKKAYLTANGIKGAEEIDFVQKIQKETGKELDTLLETTYFQTELKEFREKKATSNATPKGGKRANNTSIDTVEYWLVKGELPAGSDNKELREKIINARLNSEKNKGTFYNS